MASLRVPVIVVILGEGGSGGALAIGIGDRVLMMENAVYSVITPEGCAAILWKDAGQASRAAECLRLTATDLKNFGIIDEIIPEPEEWKVVSNGGEEYNKDYKNISANLKKVILRNLKELGTGDENKRVLERFQKFRKMGEWV
jgi:acetyl-CoA carboxylase carboxyl transferase subunit alpha